jgi:hypothetical protein
LGDDSLLPMEEKVRLLPIFAIRNTFLPVFRYRFSPARFMCAGSC